jgi:two-component system, NarL family, response regulator LiaR
LGLGWKLPIPEKAVEDPIRVLIVDDHFVVRKGVCALLLDAPDIAVVGEACDGREAIELARRLLPQVILMDLKLPKLGGVEAIQQILAEQPETGILVLTASGLEAQVLAAVEAGALGYLAKTAEREELLAAIRRIADGQLYLPASLTRRVLNHLHAPSSIAAESLTEREGEVLRLLARGRSNQEIAGKLGIAEITVRTHVSHILGKLAAGNRVQAALYALRAGLVSLEEDV